MSATLEVITEADSANLYQARHLATLLADLTSHRTAHTALTTESFCVVMAIIQEKLQIDTQPLKVQN